MMPFNSSIGSISNTRIIVNMGTNLDRYLDLYNSIGCNLSEVREAIEEIEDRYNDKEIIFQCLMRLANEKIDKTIPMFQMLEIGSYEEEAIRYYPEAVIDNMMCCVVTMMRLTAEAEVIYKAMGRHIDESNTRERQAATYLWAILNKNRRGLERIFWQIESLVPENGSMGSMENIGSNSNN